MFGIIRLLSLPAVLAGSATRPATPAVLDDSSAMTLVVVQNERKVRVTVYAQNDFGEYRLGVVDAGASETLRVANYIIGEGELEFFVQPTGQLEESAGPLDVSRGDHIGLVVPVR